jgi:hypothetical protein
VWSGPKSGTPTGGSGWSPRGYLMHGPISVQTFVTSTTDVLVMTDMVANEDTTKISRPDVEAEKVADETQIVV